MHAAFVKQGRKSPWDDESVSGDSGETEPFSREQPGLFACYQAAALGIAVSGERTGQPVLRVAFGGASSEPAASKDHGGKTEEQPVAEALGRQRLRQAARSWARPRPARATLPLRHAAAAFPRAARASRRRPARVDAEECLERRHPRAPARAP